MLSIRCIVVQSILMKTGAYKSHKIEKDLLNDEDCIDGVLMPKEGMHVAEKDGEIGLSIPIRQDDSQQLLFIEFVQGLTPYGPPDIAFFIARKVTGEEVKRGSWQRTQFLL